MSWFQRQSSPQGWIGCAPNGAEAAWALVQRPAGAPPAVRWVSQLDWGQPQKIRQSLRSLRRQRGGRQRRVLLLARQQYRLVTMDAPVDIPRAEWAAAVRWQLKDAVDFAVESAAVDVLAVPEGTSYRGQGQLIAVAAADDAVRPQVALAHEAGSPWTAIDVQETALRNLGALVEPEGRAQALLHCQDSHSTLVVTFQGELLAARQIELTLAQLGHDDDARRRQAYDLAVLELQRTLDGIERSFGQVTLARLLVTPMPGLAPFIEHLSPLLYVPVSAFAAGEALDLSAVPELAGDDLRLNRSLCAIGAALRDD